MKDVSIEADEDKTEKKVSEYQPKAIIKYSNGGGPMNQFHKHLDKDNQ